MHESDVFQICILFESISIGFIISIKLKLAVNMQCAMCQMIKRLLNVLF